MVEWEAIASVAMGGAGALMFLLLVADDLVRASSELERLRQEREKKEQRRRAKADCVVVTVQAA